MDKQTLNEYKFMDTPEFQKEKQKKPDTGNQMNWLLNHLLRGD